MNQIAIGCFILKDYLFCLLPDERQREMLCVNCLNRLSVHFFIYKLAIINAVGA